jgi:hypothetical protein
MSNQKEYTRQELYDLVWSTPMVKLAKDFGLSDVGLRKTCVKHGIPTPPLGYWAKLNFGKPVKKTPLGPPAEGVRDRVLVSVFPAAEVPDEVAQAATSARDRVQAPIVVPNEPPARFHPLAEALRRAMRSAKPDDEGFLRVGGSGVLGTAISQANRDRAIFLVDTLFKALESASQQIKATDGGIHAIVDGEGMVLRLRETKGKAAHQPTKSEMKAKADWEEQRRKWPSIYDRDRQHWRTWDNFPSGRLSLTLTDPLRSQWESGHLLGRWHDRKARSLESYLYEIVVGMLAGAAVVRHNRLAAEVAKRQRQEAHEAYLREQERLRYQARVDAFIESKADELAKLQKILSFQDYISKNQSAMTSLEEDAILKAVNDLARRLQCGLSHEALRRAVKFSD